MPNFKVGDEVRLRGVLTQIRNSEPPVYRFSFGERKCAFVALYPNELSHAEAIPKETDKPITRKELLEAVRGAQIIVKEYGEDSLRCYGMGYRKVISADLLLKALGE
jgi:hypothetical protein